MTELLGKKLKTDPRVQEAKRLLSEALEEHQSRITGLKNADPARVQDYQQLLAQCGQLRGGNLYYPYLSTGIGRGALDQSEQPPVRHHHAGARRRVGPRARF